MPSISKPSLTTVIFFAALTFSFVTTAEGIAFSLGSGAPELVHYMFGGIISLLISSCVAGFYTSMARNWFGRRYIIVGLLIVPAIFASVASGGMASTSLKTRWEQQDLQIAANVATSRDAARPAIDLANQTAEVSRLWTAYASFSRSEAELEENQGSSCDGASLGSSCGPVCELRLAQAAAAERMRDRTNVLLTEADELVARSSRQATDEMIAELYVGARALWRSPVLTELRTDVATQIRGFEGAGFPSAGDTVQCRDAEAVARLEAIQTILDTPMSNAPPPVLQEVTGTDIARMNMELLTAMLGAAVFGSLGDRPSVEEVFLSEEADQFRHFWVLSFLVELLCACLALVKVARTVPHDPMPTDIDQVSDVAHRRGLQTFVMYQVLTVRNAGKTYFAEPINCLRPNLARDAFVFAQWAGLKPQFLGMTVDMRDYGTTWETEQFYEATGTYLARFYLINRPRHFERRLAGLIGFSGTMAEPKANNPLNGEILPPLGT